jgi:hypothetical protein
MLEVGYILLAQEELFHPLAQETVAMAVLQYLFLTIQQSSITV